MPASSHPFVWYELATTDTKAAETFYTRVIGWEIRDSGMSDKYYGLIFAGVPMIGGIMQMPETVPKGVPPAWQGYVRVPDADDYAKRVTAAGGVIHHPPTDIPGVGRFAVAGDPQGAVFVLFQPGDPPAQTTPPPAGTPGQVGWRELQASDGAAAFAFYSGLFGWTKGEALDMGDMGTYQLFTTAGDQGGGMMTKMPQVPHPFWLFYFNVEAIDAAIIRVTANGGKVVNGPMPVPGDMWVVQCLDPQGAMFAMVASRK